MSHEQERTDCRDGRAGDAPRTRTGAEFPPRRESPRRDRPVERCVEARIDLRGEFLQKLRIGERRFADAPPVDGNAVLRETRGAEAAAKKRGVEYWLTYFTDFYTSSGGKLTPVKIGAVKRGLTQITMETIKPKEVGEFNSQMDNLVKKYMIRPSDQEKSEKKAVNF